MSKTLLSDSLTYGAADFITKGMAALLFPLFTRYLTVNDFGLLALITVISSMATMLIEAGLNNAVQLMYFEKRFDTNKKIVVSTGFFLQAIWGIVIILFFFLCSYFLKDILYSKYQIQWRWIILALAITIPNLLIRYCLNIIRLHYRPVIFGAVSIMANLLWMFLAIYLMRNKGMGIDGYFVANLSLLLLTLPVAVYSIKVDLGFQLDKKIAGEVFTLGFPFVFSNVAYWLFGSIDRWLLAVYTDTKEVGLYSIAYKIAIVVVMVNSAFAQAWSPVFLKRLHSNINEGIDYIHRISKYYLAVLSFACVGIILFSKYIFILVTPAEYWSASISTGLIAFAVFMNGTTQFTLIGVSFTKKTRYINYASWIAVLVNIVMNIILSKLFGAAGAAAAMILTYIALSASYNLFSKKVFSYALPLKTCIIPVVVLLAANCYNISVSIMFPEFGDLFIRILFLAVVYLFYSSYYNIRYKEIFKYSIDENSRN